MPPQPPATAAQVAAWMRDQIIENERLTQAEAAGEIATLFGEEFVYTNDNGNLAIERAVLTAFRAMTADTVVWEAGERHWRLREDFDTPGKRKAD